MTKLKILPNNIEDVNELVCKKFLFGKVTVPNFRNILDGTSNLNRDRYVYFDPIIEDHWQTFQDGWSKGVQTVGKLLAQELTKTESVSVVNVDIEQLAQKITGE